MAQSTSAFECPSSSLDGASELIALASQAASGDEPEATRFIEAVRPAMKRVISGVLGSTHTEIDDVMQQSLIALLRALPAFRGECHPAGYAARIALRTALRARRRTGSQRLRECELSDFTSVESTLPCPSEEAASERRRVLLRELLEEIPEEQADTLAMRVVLGWTLEEVALATGVPINTVRSRVRLAKEALRRRIEASSVLTEDLGGRLRRSLKCTLPVRGP